MKLNNSGVTLVELIISMVIISIALGGVLMVMNFTTGHSADPMLQHQAVAIAEAYMEEILLQNYADPDGSETGEIRATFDDVDDYNGLSDNGAYDQNGNQLNGLTGYTINVTVAFSSINGTEAKKITVQVVRGTEVDLTLSGYRTEYD